MASEGVSIVVDEKAVEAALQRFLAVNDDLSPILADISGAVLTSTQQRFEAEKGPDSVSWAPFAKSTLRSMRASRRANPKLLRDRVSPGLYSSLTAFSDDQMAEVGTNLVYGALHQFGGEVKQGERAGEATFIYAAKGAAKNKAGERVGSKLRFARASTRAKSKHTRTFTVGARTFVVPARPYLGIDQADQVEILAIIERHYQVALAAGGAQ